MISLGSMTRSHLTTTAGCVFSLLALLLRASKGLSFYEANINNNNGNSRLFDCINSTAAVECAFARTRNNARKTARSARTTVLRPAFLLRSCTRTAALSPSLDRYRPHVQNNKTRLGSCRRSSGNSPRFCVGMNADSDATGGGRGGWSGKPKKRRPLVFLAKAVNEAVLEMCVENQGRPLAMAITDLVERAIEAFASGYPLEALSLELQLLDSTTRVPGKTLTGVEKRYRTQWIGALHAVMQNLNFVEPREPKSAEEFHLKSQVDVVLRGRQTNDEQTFVKFDKALATGGVSGGVATERIVIAPQMVPISQLVLLAIRALQKLEDAAA